MKTSSSNVTPSHINEWLEILHRLPTRAPFLDLDEGANLYIIANLTTVQISEREDLDALASFTFCAISLIELFGIVYADTIALPPGIATRGHSRLRAHCHCRCRCRCPLPLPFPFTCSFPSPLAAILMSGSDKTVSTEAPCCRSDSLEASKILTTSRPNRPLVIGAVPSVMQSRKCWHSNFNGSSCLMYGTYESP